MTTPTIIESMLPQKRKIDETKITGEEGVFRALKEMHKNVCITYNQVIEEIIAVAPQIEAAIRKDERERLRRARVVELAETLNEKQI